jgi:hypothetical protein
MDRIEIAKSRIKEIDEEANAIKVYLEQLKSSGDFITLQRVAQEKLILMQRLNEESQKCQELIFSSPYGTATRVTRSRAAPVAPNTELLSNIQYAAKIARSAAPGTSARGGQKLTEEDQSRSMRVLCDARNRLITRETVLYQKLSREGLNEEGVTIDERDEYIKTKTMRIKMETICDSLQDPRRQDRESLIQELIQILKLVY